VNREAPRTFNRPARLRERRGVVLNPCNPRMTERSDVEKAHLSVGSPWFVGHCRAYPDRCLGPIRSRHVSDRLRVARRISGRPRVCEALGTRPSKARQSAHPGSISVPISSSQTCDALAQPPPRLGEVMVAKTVRDILRHVNYRWQIELHADIAAGEFMTRSRRGALKIFTVNLSPVISDQFAAGLPLRLTTLAQHLRAS
jgi:hypothetical protein